MGLLALMQSRSSSARPSNCSFNLHTTQNIIEEEEGKEEECNDISMSNSQSSSRNNSESKVPSYIDLPAITITAAQARIGHQRRRTHIGILEDTVPFQNYMKRRVEAEDSESEHSDHEVYQRQDAVTSPEAEQEIDEDLFLDHSKPDSIDSLYMEDETSNNNVTSDIYLTEYSKSDVSVLSDNEKNSLIEACENLYDCRSVSSLPTAL